MSGSCPDVDSLVALAEGRCDEEEAEALTLHAGGCEECRVLVVGLGALVEDPTTANAMLDELSDRALGSMMSPGELAGRYRVRSVVGEGAMGVVYEAEDPRLRRRVAIKSLKREPGERARSMLRDEAQALGRLQHPNVVPVFDVGDSRGRMFIAMEFVDGKPLSAWCEGRPWADVVDRFIEAARGLHAAHAVGIVHRDFKPSNVLVGVDERARVADFGIAIDGRGQTVASSGLESRPGAPPRSGEIAGTIPYMPPEQLEGLPVTERSDQYAFFVSLFEMLEGRRPFEGRNTRSQLRARKEGAPALGRSGLPRALTKLVAKGLSYDPLNRHMSMHEVAERLLAIRRASPVRRVATVVAVATVAATAVGSAFVSTEAEDCAERSHALQSAAAEYRAGLTERWSEGAFDDRVSKLAQRVDRFSERAAAQYRKACQVEDDAVLRCIERRATSLSNAVAVAIEPQTPAQTVMAVLVGATPSADCRPSAAERSTMSLGSTLPFVIDGWNAELLSLYRAGRYAEGVALTEERLETILRFGSDFQQAHARYIYGLLLGMSGRSPEGFAELLRAHAVASSGGDDRLAATVSIAVLVRSPVEENPVDGDAWLGRAEADVERANDERLRARFLSAAGRYTSRRGRTADAQAYAEAASEVLSNLERTAPIAWEVEDLLGTIALTRRDHVTALVHHERALTLLEELGGGLDVGSLQVRKGIIQSLLALGELELAQRVLVEYDAADVDARYRISRRVLRAELRQRQGDDDAALELLVDVSRGLSVSDVQWHGVMSRVGLAHLRRSEYTQARDLFERIRVQAEVSFGPDHMRTMSTLHNLAEAESELGDFDRAAEHYRQALAILDRIDPAAPARAFPLTGLGEVELALGNLEQAKAHLDAALELPLAEATERAEAEAALARTLWRLEDPVHHARATELAARAVVAFHDSPAHGRQALELERWLETL